ncbi:hypothetical protein ACGFNU_15620 [Spirillospora sp. NPDC048911]|uniref:hypothetical protein n=1 Tax=Spirillospora sp. NPDC048911 TaxID=3364527 RepID=UPI00371C867F
MLEPAAGGTMDGGQAHELVARALGRFAPGLDVRTLDDRADLRDVLALDSIDFLIFVDLMGKHVGHLIQEYDHPVLTTVGGCVDYLCEHAQAREHPRVRAHRGDSYCRTWSPAVSR